MDFPTFKARFDALGTPGDQADLLVSFADDAFQSCPGDLEPLLAGSRDRFRKAGCRTQAAHCDRILGWIAYDRADYSGALASFDRAHDGFLAEGDQSGQLRALNGLAVVQAVQGRMEQGLEVFREALALAEELGDLVQIQTFKANIGETLCTLGQYAEAETFIRESVHSAVDSDLNHIVGLNQLARVCRALGRPEEALDLLGEAISLARTGGFSSVLGEALDLLGTTGTGGAPHPRAREHLEEALGVARTAGNRGLETRILLDLGQLDLDQSRTDRALDRFQSAADLGRTIGAQLLECEAWKGLYEIWKVRGSTTKALEALETYHDLKGQIQDEKVSAQLSGLRADLARRETILLQEQSRLLAKLGDLGQKITSSLDLETIILAVYEGIGDLMKADAFGLGLYDEARQIFDFKLLLEGRSRVPPFEIPADGPTFSGWVFREREAILVNDVEKEYTKYFPVLTPAFRDGTLTTRSCLYCPLTAKGQLLGILTTQSLAPNAYTPRDLATLRTLGASISIALQNARLFDEVTRMATVDGLTGASTRRYLFQRTEQAFQQYRRDRAPLALVMVDIDHFKRLNDTWGHVAGDRVLAGFGALCLGQKRPHDLFGRYGGEEFVLVLGGTDLEGAVRWAGRLCEAVGSLAVDNPGHPPIRLTASFGVTDFTPADETIEQVIRRADEALYEAKNSGRNRVVVRGGEPLKPAPVS